MPVVSTRLGVFAALATLVLGSFRAVPQQSAGVSEADLASALAAVVDSLEDSLAEPKPRSVKARDGRISKASLQLFRRLNPELFPEFDHAAADPLAQVVSTIADTRRQLAEHGIELLVVPIPGRLHVYPEALVELDLGPDFAGFAPGLAAFQKDLRGAGVEVLDLLPHLTAARADLSRKVDELVCLRVGSHWTPKGCTLAAELIAAHVKARPWFAPHTESTTRLETTHSMWEPDSNLLPEGVPPIELTFERVLDGAGQPIKKTDPTSPIVLWGDSFTLMYRKQGADLARRLRHELGATVDVIAQASGGSYGSRAAFSRRPEALTGKRLVIWAFAARTLLRKNWIPVELQRE